MTPIDQKELEELRDIVNSSKVPDNLQAEWVSKDCLQVNRHQYRHYWWWIQSIKAIFLTSQPMHLIESRRLLALLSLGCAAPRLLAEIERLRAIIDKEKP